MQRGYGPAGAGARQLTVRVVCQRLAQDLYEPRVSECPRQRCSCGEEGSDRVCTDFRPSGTVTGVPSYRLPRIQQALGALQAKESLPVSDFLNAHWQNKVRPGNGEFFAFSKPDWQYAWTRMPFGAPVAPVLNSGVLVRCRAA